MNLVIITEKGIHEQFVEVKWYATGSGLDSVKLNVMVHAMPGIVRQCSDLFANHFTLWLDTKSSPLLSH